MKRSLVLVGAAGTLIAACSLEVAGISAQGASGPSEATSSSAAGTGGHGGNGAGGGDAGGMSMGPIGDPEACPGAAITLAPPGLTFDATLAGRKHELQPGCGPMGAPDVVYAVTPTVTGTLTATLTSKNPFPRSLSLRSVCPDEGPPGELTCASNTDGTSLAQAMWVTAGRTVFVVVDGDPQSFTLALTLSECGDGKVDPLEECDDEGCLGCVACTGSDELWDASKKRCYRLVSSPASWAAARASCVAWGGDLAGVSTTEELDFLRNAPAIMSAGDIWSGGFALQETCSFAWADGEPWFSSVFGKGEPNNAGGNERCLGFYAAQGHFMDDSDCAGARAYLCERAPEGSCGDGIVQAGEECDDLSAPLGTCKSCQIACGPDEFKDPFTHHCYKLVTGQNQANWDDAKTMCAVFGGHLAVISSTEENRLIAGHLGGDTWIDGRWDVFNGGHWDTGDRFCFDNWASGEPSLSIEYCVESYANGTWNNQSCGDSRDYVCEREP